MRWGWILLGGFLAEFLVFVMVIPLSMVAGQDSLLYSATPASFLATFAFGWWIARKTPHRRLLHGTLVGVVAAVIYVAMTLGRPEPIAYLVAHVLKVLGGALGGFIAMKRADTGTDSEVRQTV